MKPGTTQATAGTNVHIVAQADRWILGRCVNLLQRHTGWTVSSLPDPKADVNYYMPYLLIKEPLPPTRTAAWFTHREEIECAKTRRWWQAAAAVDLRITIAERYRVELERFGETVNIPVPVDLKKFRPRPLRVGVAGQVYALSRKGEDLVKRLVREPGLEVVAAGKGWPCPTTYYAWEKMHEFYQQLDVFLVTSTVEGGPMTMQEALACGIPVVAPKGVGMVDEFPVLTYEKGDYDSMLSRVRQLALGRTTRRRWVTNRTEEAYVRLHEEVLCAA